MAGPALKAAAAAAAVLATLTATPVQACTWQTAVDAGALQSDWRETDGDGRQLVQERGRLDQAAVEWAGNACRFGSWSARFEQAQGRRDYGGSSSSGAALQTRSRIQRQALVLQALPLSLGPVQLGARLRWQRLERDIQSTASANGYPERHDTLQAALLLGAGGDLGASALQWSAHLAWGGGPGGRMRLSLPGYDAATLRLGASRLLQAELQLQGNFSRQWTWRIGVQHGSERSSAGPAQAITRNGLVVGGASQPATQQRGLGLSAALGWTFDG